MPHEVFLAALTRIRNHCLASGQNSVSVTLHGGEPCLAGSVQFGQWCAQIHAALDDIVDVELCLQTNATPIDAQWVDQLVRAANIPLQILSVIQFGTDPVATHRHFVELGAKTINYLLPDFNHDTIGPVRALHGPTPCADFLIPIFDEWWHAGTSTTKVGPFWQMTRVILGGESDLDLFGNPPLRSVSVKTDGAIELLDTLRTCVPGSTGAGLSVLDHEFSDVKTLGDGVPLPRGCGKCPEWLTCAGGDLPHRYSTPRGFDNPSVWCADLLGLFTHMRAKLGVDHATTTRRRLALKTSTTNDDVSALDLVDALTWSRTRAAANRVHQQYLQLLLGEFERVVDELRLVDKVASERLLDCVATLDNTTLVRILTAPEVSYRLLCPPDRPLLEVAEFISRATLAESARAGTPVRVEQPTWTALGDTCVSPDGGVQGYAVLSCGLPVDLGSPHTANVDFGGAGNHPGERREPFAEGEVQHLYESLAAALDGIRETNERSFEFIGRFNKVLICQKDPAAPTRFSSGSTGQYIGRSFVTNPHIDGIDEIDLAEALVQQGIHGLLYMDDRRRPWMTTPATDATWPALDSPWGGSRLSVRSYVQACFVWFGLAQFWTQALSTSSFPAARARRSLARCVFGFTKGSLLDRLDPYAEGIRPDLRVAIEAMQTKICAVETPEPFRSPTQTAAAPASPKTRST